MKRRSFLSATTAAIATAIMRPTVLLRNEINRESILLGFCDPGYVMRYDLTKPFTLGSLTYATDARIMVRAELVNPINDGQDIKRPPAEKTFNELWKTGLQFRDLDIPRKEDLLFGYGECPVCHGRRISVENDWEHYCSGPDFDGDDCTIQDRSCDWCWDTKKGWPRDKIRSIAEVDGFRFAESFLRKVALIPNVRVAASATSDSNATHRIGLMQFHGEGFQGVLMGVTQ